MKWYCGAKAHASNALHLPNGWTRSLAGLLLVLVISLVVFFDTWASIIDIWLRSKTYTHGFVIAPISLWLIWSRRHYYLHLLPAVSYLALAGVVASGFAWLTGDLIHVVFIKQLAAVGMLVSGFWAVLGNSVASSMSFPLLFLFFMVPMGEELIPPLIEFTTSFTVKFLRLTGISVYREGNFFTLTTGSWSVVEACSGISYLIASVTLGFVFAYLNYAYYWKRALFMLLSGIVPIIANGFRAYIIVMIGHLSDMKLAVGVDHLIYGGVFFGLVMLLLFYLGSFWRDPPFIPISIVAVKTAKTNTYQILPTIAMVTILFGIWPVLSSWLINKQAFNGLPAYVVKPELNGWHPVENPQWIWTPQFDRAVDHNIRFYSNGTYTVGLYQASFGKEEQGAELVNSENRLIRPDDFNRLRTINIAPTKQPTENDRNLAVNSTLIKGAAETISVLDWYQLGAQITGNPFWAKGRQLIKRLTGDTSPELKVVLWMRSPERDHELAVRILKNFLKDWARQNNLSLGS